ncbi:molybdopterin-dependent oxidoreductase [Hoeflea sp.]|uniref:molybdopterin-dependent oxidoreductase n=1 Tax=Hoeflea sp. TaxID=1940281 RepID=UPI00199C630D|nr:molybdopterin-dependent oxidoreductase [Hoeflea sp.]MBC7285339.1 molybdopterin-dependent oxidoreductase [Hoeflea sp.]
MNVELPATWRQRILPRLPRLVGVAAALLCAAPPALAQGEVLLTVIESASGKEITFDRGDLEALPRHRLDTHTSVTDGVHHFEGPLMRDLLGVAQFHGEEILATALNDYEVTIPLSDFERFDVIAALEMDGKALTPRDKGPIWIVYPRDDHAELQDIRFDYRWVWQLCRVEIR